MAMNLVSMKQSKKKESNKAMTVGSGREAFPYGLEIRLGHDELKKLGINVTSFKAGEKLYIVAHGSITSLENSDRMGDGKKQRMEIQIEKMTVKQEKPKTEIESILAGGKRTYGKKEKIKDSDNDGE